MAVNPIVWGLVVLALAGGSLLGWHWRGKRDQAVRRSWPEQWNLNARTLFTVHERALYRELTLALPQHVIMAKVSLLRFCHSADERDARAWYERLHPLHVSFVICTPNGTVISAIDVEHGGKTSSSQRNLRLKEGVLEACRIRYVRCHPGQWPSTDKLATWALGQASGSATEMPRVKPSTQEALSSAGHQLANKLKQRRAERQGRWSESGFTQDSFFAFDSRYDHVTAANSAPVPLDEAQAPRPASPVRPSPESN